MQTDTFIANVQQECPEIDPKSIGSVTLIAVRTLSEHMLREDAQALSVQLPKEIGKAVEEGGAESVRSRTIIEPEGFYEQLVARIEIDHDTARRIAHAVVSTLQIAVADGETGDIDYNLPDEFDALLVPSE